MSLEVSPQSTIKSPKLWQKPTSRIKLKIKKRKPSKSSYPTDNLPKPLVEIQNGGGRTKRSNPFSCTSEAKKRPSQLEHASSNRLFKALDDQVENQPPVSVELVENNFQQIETAEEEQQQPKGEETETTTLLEATILPVDWSLKTKVRFKSSASFSWVSSLKTADVAESISNFVRCHESNTKSSCSSSLRSACKVWMHPWLPWLQLYPRYSSTKKLDDDIILALQTDWISSFHSLFNLLRSGHCPYFYMCSGQFSVLFIADSSQGMVAIATPTTKGFRDALQKEGIEFSQPHSKTTEQAGDMTSDSEDENDDKENQSDNEEWLESVGLAKDQFPSLEKRTKQQEIQIRNTDQQPSSTVMITGANTLALSNFILNWKGIMSGIPPTLLAPVAFDGAVLKSHKVTQGVVKHQQANNMKQVYSLEISGAILPGCFQRVCQILQTRHGGPFTATVTPHQSTQPLNTGESHCISTLQNAGLMSDEQEYFSTTNKHLDKTCLKDFTYSNGIYTWT